MPTGDAWQWQLLKGSKLYTVAMLATSCSQWYVDHLRFIALGAYTHVVQTFVVHAHIWAHVQAYTHNKQIYHTNTSLKNSLLYRPELQLSAYKQTQLALLSALFITIIIIITIIIKYILEGKHCNRLATTQAWPSLLNKQYPIFATAQGGIHKHITTTIYQPFNKPTNECIIVQIIIH